jgi:PAS domain-containing protein
MALVLRDMNGKVTLWSREAERLYDCSRDEAVGQLAHELLETQYPGPVGEINSQLIEHGRWEGTLVNTTRGGKEVVVCSIWTLKLDERGEPLAILELDRPVDERTAL